MHEVTTALDAPTVWRQFGKNGRFRNLLTSYHNGDLDERVVVTYAHGDTAQQVIELDDTRSLMRHRGLHDAVMKSLQWSVPDTVATALGMAFIEAGCDIREASVLDLVSLNGSCAAALKANGFGRVFGTGSGADGMIAAQLEHPGALDAYTSYYADDRELGIRMAFNRINALICSGDPDKISGSMLEMAWDHLRTGSWLALTIHDRHGRTTQLVDSLQKSGRIGIHYRETFVHRRLMDGNPLSADLIVGRKVAW